MDDLLSELDCIDGAPGPSRDQKDRPSSPLRPNSKYCSMVQPEAMRPAPIKRAPAPAVRPAGISRPRLSGSNLTPIGRPDDGFEGMGKLLWESRERTPASTVPQTVQQILAVTAGGMEVDEDPQISDKSSSPLKPNEKYCSIATPARPRVARVAPQPAVVQRPARSAQPGEWVHDDDGWRLRTSSYPGHHHDLHGRTGGAPPHYSKPADRPTVTRTDGDDYYVRSYVYDRSGEPHPSAYGNHGVAGPSGRPPYHDRRSSLDSHDFSSTSRSANAQDTAWTEWNRQREMEDLKRVQRENEKRRREEAETAERERAEERRLYEERKAREKRRYEEQKEREKEEEEKRKLYESGQRRYNDRNVEREKEKAEERRRYEADVLKAVEERQRAERRARAQLNSYAEIPKPKREESTVSMTREELEELKARCKAEGEREAARRAEAVARLNRCLQKIEEPEPMEVEESDIVESSIPTSSSNMRIAPIPLIVKAEPPDELNVPRPVDAPQPVMRVQEIPHPAGPLVKEIEKVGEEKEKEGEEAKKDEDEIQIIDKPPSEVVTLSDDEGTVAKTTVDRSKEIKQEPATASTSMSSITSTSTAVEDDFWIIGSQRGRKKRHVFDLSKVKKEKADGSGAKVSETSATPQTIPFNAAKVKEEPSDRGKSSGGRRKEKGKDAVPLSSRVKPEPADSLAREAAVTPSQPVQQQLLQPVVEERGLEGSGELQGSDVAAALVAARRLLREIGKPAQQLQSRPVRQPRQVHQPSPGSFMHSLRHASRKRSRWCDVDEDEEDWLRTEESSERHDWGAKRGRMEEDEEEEEEEEEGE